MTTRYAVILALPLALVPLMSASAADEPGTTYTCVPLSQIEETPIIDDRTILMKMRGADDYRRIDMRGRCPSLRMSGFAHSTPSDDLCTSNTLVVRSPARTPCMIERIVAIDDAEAEALLAKQ